MRLYCTDSCVRGGFWAKHLVIIVILLLLNQLFGLLILTAHAKNTDSFWKSGRYQKAAVLFSKNSTKARSRDLIKFLLEEGAAYRASGNIKKSIYAFNKVTELISQCDAKPELSLTDESGALLTNLSILPYKGTSYDRIMLSCYSALNHMQIGDMPGARVQLNKSLEYQRDALHRNAKRIDQAVVEANKNKARTSGYDVEKAQNDPKFQQQYNQVFGKLNEMAIYAPYVNPFTTFIDGLYFSIQAVDQSDLERARKSFERVSLMNPSNGYLVQEIKLVETLLSSKSLSPKTYVLFETGMAPGRDCTTIDIPLFIAGNEDVPYVGAPFPKIVFNNDFIPELEVLHDSETSVTKLICDMDSVIAQEFNNTLPETVIKTVLATVAKTAAQKKIQETGEGKGFWNKGLKFAGVLYQKLVNKCDLRTWVTLPRQFGYCRIETPDSGLIQIRCPELRDVINIKLVPQKHNVVYVKSSSSKAKLSINKFVLNP